MPAPLPHSHRDEQTLELLVQGDPQGLRRLLEDHGGVVRAFVHRKFCTTLNDWQIDEAIGLAMIRVWESAPRIEATTGTLRSWFAVIARDRAMMLMTQTTIEQPVQVEPLEDVEPASMGLAPSRYDSDRVRLVVDTHRCLDRLEPLQHAVVLADLNAGTTLSAAVLSARLGRETSAIEIARTTGRRELRKMLQQLGHDADESVGELHLPHKPPHPDPQR